MFKSFFVKLLFIFTFLIIIAIGSVTYIQNHYYTKIYIENKVKEVQNEAFELSEKIVDSYNKNNNSVSKSVYKKKLDFMSEKYDALIWIVDLNGEITDTQTSQESFIGKQVPTNVYDTHILPITKGEIVVTTELFKSNDTSKIITIGVPITNDGGVIGAILINTNAHYFSSFTESINGSLWLIPVIAFGVAVVFVFLASVYISKPLSQLNKLAIQAGKGNFDYRINISSQTEIDVIGENLNNMMKRLEQMESFRSDFIQNASHELKAPITVISGYCQALKDNQIEDDKRQEYLNIILNETDRMKQLIETLMSLSKIESGNEGLNKEHFNINDVLSQKLIAFEFEIEKKNLDIDVAFEHHDLIVCADKSKIEQVIINLIQNAIKYTKEKDKISIITKQVKAKAYIEIKDTGVGISKKDLEKIFDRFYTVDKAKTPGKSGSGIGLSLVKTILELHDSKIYVESEKGQYSKFYFYLDM